jgi:hypothetical protein
MKKVILIIIAIGLIMAGIYFYKTFHNHNSDYEVNVFVGESSISVIKDSQTIQVIPVDTTGLEIINSELSEKVIKDQDINFDGHNDLAIFAGIGYMGVNVFYDYYIFDPKSSKFEKDSVLVGIADPEFNSEEKEITSHYKNGPQWYIDTFQFNGLDYDKISSDREG